jgi:hypothetical protein
MEQMPEKPIQEVIDTQVAALKQNATIPAWEQTSSEFRQQYSESPRVINNVIQKYDPAMDLNAVLHQPKHFLASVSKIALEQLIARYLPDYNKPIIMLPATAAECFGRSPSYFQKHYPELFELIATNFPADQLLLLQRIERTKAENELVAQMQGDIKALMTEALAAKPVVMTTDQLMYQALTLSSNTATRQSRAILLEIVGDDEKLNTELEALYPGYSATKSTVNFAHWRQPDANIGHYEVFAAKLDEMMRKRQVGAGDEDEQELLKYLVNNPIDFKFDMTTKLRQGGYLKELDPETGAVVKNGVEEASKTGSYGCTFWIPILAQQVESGPSPKLPPHMLMSIVFSVAKPDGEVVTFYAYREIEVPLPPIKDEEGVHYPDDDNPEYKEFIGALTLKQYAIFRELVWQQLLPYISTDS